MKTSKGADRAKGSWAVLGRIRFSALAAGVMLFGAWARADGGAGAAAQPGAQPTTRPATQAAAHPAVSRTTTQAVEPRTPEEMLRRGRYAEAEAAYRQALRDRPGEARLGLGLFEALMRQGKYEEAGGLLGAHATEAANSPDYLVARAELDERLGRYEEAEAACRKAIELDGDHFAARYGLAHLLGETGRTTEAIAAYGWFEARLRQAGPKSAAEATAAGRALARLGVLTGEPGRHVEYVLHNLYQDAYEKADRTYWPARVAAGDLLREKHNEAEAGEEYSAALQINPRAVEALVGLALMRLEGFDFDSADELLGRAEQVNANDPAVWAARARASLWERRYADAAVRAERGLAINARHPDSLRAAAVAYRLSNAPGKSNEAMERLGAVHANDAVVHHWMGTFLAGMRQYADSQRAYLHAIELAPNWAEPRAGLGSMYMEWGREAAAREALQAAWALDKYNQKTFNQLEILKILSGLQTFETAHFVVRYQEPQDRILRHYLGDLLEEAYRDVCGAYGYEPSEKTVVEAFGSHEQFVVRTTGMPWVVGLLGACTGRVIALASPRRGSVPEPFDIARVLRHEFTHTVTLGATGNRIPHWLTEGLAVHAEQAPRPWPWVQQLAIAYRQKRLFPVAQITWSFIRPRHPGDRSLAYAQAHWMVEYIVGRYGFDAVLRMLSAFDGGATQAGAFAQVLGTSEADFDRAFLAFAGRQLRTWGFDASPLPGPEEIHALLQQHSDDPNALAAAAVGLIYSGHGAAQALGLVQRALEQDANNAAALAAAAEVFEATGQEEEAGAVCRKLVLVDPNSAAAHRGLARAALASEDWVAARRHLEALRSLQPLDPLSYQGMAALHLMEGRADQAALELVELARPQEHDPQYHIRLVELYRRGQQYDQAIAAARAAMWIDLFDAGRHLDLADLYFKTGQARPALEEYRVVCELEPGEADHFAHLAVIADRLGLRDEALGAARQAVGLDPASPARKLLSRLEGAAGSG